MLLVFFGLGIGLAFTPCVLPMVPILSSIIAGQGAGDGVGERHGEHVDQRQVEALARRHAGVVVALLGKNVQALFQNPYILVTFSAVFVALALAMFDVYQLQVPGVIQTCTACLRARPPTPEIWSECS